MRFVAVGCAAAVVHWAVVVALVEHAGWAPLLANVLGWGVAFVVSFFGHHRWTFRGHHVPAQRATVRFFVVSAGGFAANEAAYAGALQWGAHDYRVLLAAVLVAVAAVTYLLSRHWVFLGSEGR